MKASQEFTELATDAEHRWSRALQQEHTLRLQLQDSLEMLANQMHGLENQAKRANWSSPKSAIDILSLASRGSGGSSPSADLKDRKLGASVSEADVKGGGTDGEEQREQIEEEELNPGEEDEDKFYDAPEADDIMIASVNDRTHSRNQSAGSVNDMQVIADVCPGGDLVPFSAKNAMMVCCIGVVMVVWVME